MPSNRYTRQIGRWFGLPSHRRTLINSDDTDHPDFDTGSWTTFAFVIVMLLIAVATMIAMAW